MIPDWLLANHAPRKYEFRKVAERDRPLVETLLRARAKELLAQVDGDLMDRFKKETSIDRLGKFLSHQVDLKDCPAVVKTAHAERDAALDRLEEGAAYVNSVPDGSSSSVIARLIYVLCVADMLSSDGYLDLRVPTSATRSTS